MTEPYGNLFDHEFVERSGDWELFVAKIQYPNRPVQFAYNIRHFGSSCCNDGAFGTKD